MTARWLVALCALAIAQPSATSAPAGAVVRVEHRDPSALPSRGPVDALVTIEVFFTPGQTSRSQYYRNLERLQANHPSRIRLVYRVVKSGGQTRTPYAALQAHAEGKFFELVDALNAAPRVSLDNRELIELGVKVGLDARRLEQAILRPPRAYDDLLEANELRRKQRLRSRAALPAALFNGRPTSIQLGAMSMNDLEREYRAAKELAEELLDRGVDRGSLAEALDELVEPPQNIVVRPGPIDDDLGDEPAEPMLATPPLDLRGMPSYGPVEAATTIVVLCSLTSTSCLQPLRAARDIRDWYPTSVRVVWAPYFDLTREDAAKLSLLSDAALCAEKLGIMLEDQDATFANPASPGWRWVEAMLGANHRWSMSPDKLLDWVTEKLRVDRRAFATCRANIAGASIAWVEAARRSGVRVTPSTVVGGRIYGPIIDRYTLQLLVEAELAPGLLGVAAPSWTRTGSAR